ncbi:MAG: hypothetical protein IKF80_01825 [Erysipelotrichaceae bacterium]|nr:hypothetical protein [Erysipelotrichaceae bacterium]
MKKIIRLTLFIFLALMLVGCAGGSTGGSGKKSMADDDVLALHFTAPSEYSEVERYCETTVDGKLIEKDIVFSFNENESVGFAVMPATKLADLTSIDNLEHYDVNGFTVYRFDTGNTMIAFVQNGDDLYAVERVMSEVDDGTVLKEVVNGISFTKNTTTETDEAAFEEMNYELDKDHSLYGTSTRITTDAQGNLVRKFVNWIYGTEKEEDFTFAIRYYANKTIEELWSADNTYEDVEFNGVKYKALVNSSGEPSYAYYTQQGNDVYLIRNNGTSDGWFTNRSEESNVCFEKFLNTISFK